MDRLDAEIQSILNRKSDLPEGVSLKDADTAALANGQSLRLQGINARETSKFLPNKIEGSQLGADLQTKIMEDITREGGYSSPTFSGDMSYKRNIGDLYSPSQGSLTHKALEMGVVDPTIETTPSQYNAMAMGSLERAQRRAEGNKTQADKILDQLNNERNKAGFMAKRLTDTAAQFGAIADDKGVNDYFAGPAIIRPDEDRLGKATSNWDTGWEQGKLQMMQGLAGSLDMLADKTGSEWLKDKAKSNLTNYGSELADLPQLRNGEAFDKNGNWKLDSFGKLIDYTIGTAAASTPQMLATIVATLASPVTYGTSMAPIAAIYTGQVWNDQKDKNATAAILAGVTMSALDNMSLGFLGKAAGMNLTRKASQELVLKELEKKMTRAEAEVLLKESLTKSIKEVSDAMKVAAHNQNIGLKAIGAATAKSTASESVTETAQELTQYFGSQSGFTLPSSPEEMNALKTRLMNAGVGGAVLGGAFGGAGKTVATLTSSKVPYDPTSDVKFREQQLNKINDYLIDNGKQAVGHLPTTQHVIHEAIKSQLHAEELTSLDRLAQPEEAKRSTDSLYAKAASAIKEKGLKGLWGKSAEIIMGEHTHKSLNSAALATILGAGRPLQGSSIDEHQAMVESNIFSKFGSPEELSSRFGGLNPEKSAHILSDSKVSQAIINLAETKRSLFSNSTKDIAHKISLDLGKYEQYKDSIIEYADRISNLIESYNEATKEKFTVDDFINYKPLDKTLVSRNSGQFVKDLQEHLGMSNTDALNLTNAVLSNDNVNSFEDAFDELINGGADKIKNKAELEAAIANPKVKGKFTSYTSNSILDNAYSLAARAAAKNTSMTMIGKDGAKLAALVQAMLDEGSINEAEAGFIAKEIKDVLAIRNGTYHPINNPYVKGALNTINFLSTIVSLPLAAVSSTVEFAQIYRNLNRPQSIKATRLLLKSTGQELDAIFRELASKVTDKVPVKESALRSELSKAGYLKEGGVGRRNDVLASYFQKWTEGFFKITGLQSVTAITRHARLGIAADAISHWFDVVKNNIGTEQEINDAKDHLTRIGVDYDYMLSIDQDTTSNEKYIIDNLQRATYAFVNEAVVIPTTLNRPKFYSDPYLRLFTTFQGYTSTFTATILPRLIGDLGKKGSDDQKNAAAVIAMMVALSILALYIKDMVKYGESPPKWASKGDKELLRVINQMGILGSGQRVFDQLFPILESGKRDSIFKQLADQSPQLVYIQKVEKALTAPENKRIEQGAKLLPIFGTSPAFAKYLQKELGGFSSD